MTKAQIQEIKDKFVGQWLMKKTKMPFGRDGHTKLVAFELAKIDVNNNQLYTKTCVGITYPIEKVLTKIVAGSIQNQIIF